MRKSRFTCHLIFARAESRCIQSTVSVSRTSARNSSDRIEMSGLSSPAPSKELAVTGGTGRYVGAAGRLHLVEHGDGTGSLVITLRR